MNWWALLPLTAVVALSAALLRRWPLPALAVLLADSVAMQATPVLRFPLLSLSLPILLTGLEVCFIAATRSRLVSILAAILTIGVQVYRIEGGWFLVIQLTGRPASPLAVSQTVAVTLTTVVAWLAGYLIRQSHAHAETLRAQAQAQAATAERLRLARELHDMVAHSIGVIAIQAGMGRRVIDTQPAEARQALGAIEAASRETLAGLRRMLGALRSADPSRTGSPDPAGTGLADPRCTGPSGPGGTGLADLGRLVAASRQAGVGIEVRWRGPRGPIPPEVDLSAFRIVQEAVTNVVRHAAAEHCQVLIDHRHHELAIEVVDDGQGGSAVPGYGIIGMRERADLLGGQLTAGLRPGGGFRVAARLPLPAAVR